MRVLWGLLGVVAMALALIGVALPIMPTVPFLIVAAFAFARSSRRMHDWLMTHPVFSPPIHHWHAHRAIATRVKAIALASMAVGVVVGGVMLPPKVWIWQLVVIGAISAFVLSRPAPPTEE